VSFSGAGSTDPAGSALAYDWSFGDGSTGASVANPSHVFTAPGNYTVSLTVTNGVGQTSTTTKSINVVVDTPSPAFVVPSAIYAGYPATFDGTSSSDPAGSPLSYAWTYADSHGTTIGTDTAPISKFTFPTTGTYSVTLAVTNGSGVTKQISKTVTVTPDPPIASFVTITAAVPLAGQAIAFDGSGSHAVTGSITSYAWNFGDGAAPASGATTSHAFTKPGTYLVSLTVTDGNRETGTVAQPVTVHAPPAASFAFSPTAPVDRTLVTFSGGGSFNPDASTAITSYAWSFGDGATGSGASVTHRYGQPGRYIVQLTVMNSLGLSNTTTQVVTVGDEPPSAVITLPTAKPASGHPVAFSGVSSSDPDGSIVSYRWDFGDGSTATKVAPAHTYAKPGVYTVKLTVTDSSGGSATTSRSVTVALSGRIVKTSLQTSRTGATLLVAVNSAGALKAGRKTIHLRRAGTARIPITLTAAQLRTVLQTHRLSVRVAVRFIPSAGPQATRTVSVTFHPPRVVRGRLAAVLRRQ
jgi:PKD repeat protein